ncbi:MAG: permease-like cell division protein FtsX [Dethiobacteria bacterium]|nr:permease-like cell division protein FtsX [Dethiobacteria bacterium]
MFISGFFYIIGETFKGLYRNRWMCITSTGVVVVTLLMLGVFMMVNLNIGHITDTVKDQVEIVVYIDDLADDKTLGDLENQLATHPKVEAIRYVSSEEHMGRLQRQLGGMLEGYESGLDNPLLASYEVRTWEPESVVPLAEEFETYPGVSAVFYGQGYVENLFAVTGVMQMVGLALMVGLSITAVFLISHTIKLTVMMRKREITIMKYVGATNWFIRWPFVLEGLLMGFAGAALPMIGLYYIYQFSVDWVITNNLLFLSLLPVRQVVIELAKYLVPLGTALGVLGSMFSMGRFLKV